MNDELAVEVLKQKIEDGWLDEVRCPRNAESGLRLRDHAHNTAAVVVISGPRGMQDKELRGVFELVDKDGSGVLTRDEIAQRESLPQPKR